MASSTRKIVICARPDGVDFWTAWYFDGGADAGIREPVASWTEVVTLAQRYSVSDDEISWSAGALRQMEDELGVPDLGHRLRYRPRVSLPTDG
jgi:hypothetical protein